jgi:hypothetical protein
MVTLPQKFVICVTASFHNPRAEGSFDIVHFPELGLRERLDAVLRHEHP